MAMNMLNPFAMPFRPVYGDEHCMFLTFSNGYPLTEAQIYWFFNGMYPGLVEEVYVNRPGPRGQPSLFGKVMFKRRDIPGLIIGDSDRVGFEIDGMPLYCRRYVAKDKMNLATSASGRGGPRGGGSHH